MGERIQKLLSAFGACSRRQAEQWMIEGRITVNGLVAKLGDKADPLCDIIALDGVPVSAPSEKTYLMLNKPKGYVTTLSDEQSRKTVRELVIGCGARVYPVGRLDLNSEGLLLMTDDGALAHRLTHPSHEVKKEYLVWVRGDVKQALPILRSKIQLDGTWLRPAEVRLLRTGESSLLSIRIHEGKNRQVRRMCALSGLHVTRLKRIAVGALQLDTLQPGQWRNLTSEEVVYLKSL